MSNIDSGKQTESNNSYDTYRGKSRFEESYEEYEKRSLPGENTATIENCNASNNSYDSYRGKSRFEESYEEYGKNSLPGENTTHRENGNADNAVYDRYEYEGAETPDQEANLRLKKLFCKKGTLFNSKKKYRSLRE